jgi:recombinational DNA repair protein RecR
MRGMRNTLLNAAIMAVLTSPEKNKMVCSNCKNFTKQDNFRGICSEKRADKIHDRVVEDHSCRFFEAQL